MESIRTKFWKNLKILEEFKKMKLYFLEENVLGEMVKTLYISFKKIFFKEIFNRAGVCWTFSLLALCQSLYLAESIIFGLCSSAGGRGPRFSKCSALLGWHWVPGRAHSSCL